MTKLSCTPIPAHIRHSRLVLVSRPAGSGFPLPPADAGGSIHPVVSAYSLPPHTSSFTCRERYLRSSERFASDQARSVRGFLQSFVTQTCNRYAVTIAGP